MRSTLLAATTLALVACAPVMPLSAEAAMRASPPTRLAQVDVIDRDTGEHLAVYWHDGQRWVAGAPGHRYAVAVRNHDAGRILAVVSVDGVNAVSGETACWNQGGYVLSPGESYDIRGWRKSTADVADFLFTAVEDSYAARTGRAADVGIIGVAVFTEARPRTALEPRPMTESAKSAPLAQMDQPAAPAAGASPVNRLEDASRARLGTGHGQRESAPVSLVDFERERDRPDEIITIRYDRFDRLLAMGVIPPAIPLPVRPNAFPATAEAGFVPDPPRR